MRIGRCRFGKQSGPRAPLWRILLFCLLLTLTLLGACSPVERAGDRGKPPADGAPRSSSPVPGTPGGATWAPGGPDGAPRSSSPVPADWETYTNRMYGVTLKHPRGWRKMPGHGDGISERYGGADGFFQIDALNSPGRDLDEVAREEAGHKLRPYGTRPVIERLAVAGQPARLILPSADQPEEMKGEAMLIIDPPAPVRIAGQSYGYLVLHADREHIRPIAATIALLAR